MHQTNGNGKRETLRLEVDQPVIASLLFDTPLQVQGRWGDQYMYTLQTDSGERVLYVDPAVRALIDQAGLRRGESFKIGKMSRRDGNRRGVEWKVRKLDPEEPAPQPDQQKAGILQAHDQMTDRPQPSTDKPHSRTQLEDAIRTAIGAWHAGQLYAQETGFQMPPITSEDIRALTITCFIQKSRGGAR